MKILLFCHLGQIREYAEYVSALKRIGPVDAVFLTMGQKEYELALEVAAFDVVKDILPRRSELDGAETDPLVADRSLRSLEDRIGYRFVNRDILVDRFFRGQPRLEIDSERMPLIWTGPRTRLFMHLVGKRLQSELTGFRPDFMFVETSFAPTRMAWRLAQELGIPAGGFMSVRFWPERLYLETGIGYDWQNVRKAYAELGETPLADAELDLVKQRLRTFIDEKTKPAYLQTEHAKGATDFRKRLHPRRLYAGLDAWLGSRSRTSTTNPQVLPGEIFSPVEKIRRYWRGSKAKRYLHKHRTPFTSFREQKYAIYFLHVEPEITVEGMAFDFQDQTNTLRNVLAALPADMNLVVKEHSPMLGFRPVEVYNQLTHMPGLIIADTHEDSHTLISHASVVITLTGTVALEAILYGIPAIVLGSIYFDEFEGVYKPKSFDELRTLLADPEKLRGATEDCALRTLGSMRRASQPGRPPRVDVTVEAIDSESAQTMMAELKKLRQ